MIICRYPIEPLGEGLHGGRVIPIKYLFDHETLFWRTETNQ